MRGNIDRHAGIRIAASACALLIFVVLTPAAEVRLKNGLQLEGIRLDAIRGLTDRTADQNEGNVNAPTMLVVNAGPKRYFVGNRQLEERVFDARLGLETFTFKHKRTGSKRMVASLGSFTHVEPFDAHGRRTVTIRTDINPEEKIIQGITEISPFYTKIAALNYDWDLAVATTSIPPAELDAILRQATDKSNPDDRLKIARFYLQAGMHRQANAEVESIVRDFPELKQRSEGVFKEVREFQAGELLAELRRRRSAGQDQLALEAIRLFPAEGMSAAVLRQVREMQAEYDQIRQQIDRVTTLLGDLQARVGDSTKVAALQPMRSAIGTELNEETVGRLDSFLKLVDDPTLEAEEKLALAYSAWVLGSNNALQDLDEAIRLWDARFLASEYLRADGERERADALEKLKKVEGLGAARLLQMVPQLPQPLENPGAMPGVAKSIVSHDNRGETPVTYSILLPPEYSADRSYPLIVALRPAERRPEDMLMWWGGDQVNPGQSQRHGYIVIAPHYVGEDARQYAFDVESHRIVRAAIADARKRFNIDSDRIFLTGHGMGGDACFDIGMSHPDLFAGIIPITGISQNYCSQYWSNAKNLPMFIVGGLDRNSFDRNAESGQVDRMIRSGYDVLYCDYVARGYESYFEEIHKLFEWMALHRRAKEPRDFEMKMLRPSENRFFWLEGQGFPLIGTQRTRPVALTFSAKATIENTIHIRSGAKRHIIWLSSDVVDFNKRVVVKTKGFQKFNDFVQPQMETILEDLRVRGDRQRIYSARIEVGS